MRFIIRGKNGFTTASLHIEAENAVKALVAFEEAFTDEQKRGLVVSVANLDSIAALKRHWKGSGYTKYVDGAEASRYQYVRSKISIFG